jgi:hypothetical protein
VRARVINICGTMGRLPAEIRALSPLETFELVEAWNAVNASDEVDAPTADEFDDLVRRYG